MQTKLLRTSDSEWLDVLKRHQHDFYHLPSYLDFLAAYENSEALGIYVQDSGAEFFAPVLARPLPEALEADSKYKDLVSPYGYSNPLISPQASCKTQSELIKSFKDALKELNFVSAFFRMHPLLMSDKAALRENGELKKMGETVWVDLEDSLEQMDSNMRSGYRKEARKLERLGFRCSMDEWSNFDEFIAIYIDTMGRLKAKDYYFFSRDNFYRLKDALGQKLHLCSVYSPNRDIACAALFSENNGIVQYHLSGTAEAYLKQSPNKLMLRFVRDWAKERGNQYFHLGGGVGGDQDPLFHFKKGFSKKLSDFFGYRVVLNEDVYFELCKRAKVDTNSDYFPAYRILRSAAESPK